MYESTKLTYAGDTPLMGAKFLNSKAFYGGIGANVQETFAVTEMEKDQTTFFVSTTPYDPQEPADPQCDDYFEAPSDLLSPGVLQVHGRIQA